MIRTLRTSWKRCSGLTLIELVVTLIIAAALAMFIAPSFMGIILDSRLTAQINSMVSSLNLARSQAINRGVRVGVCASTSQTACGSTGTGEFESGWIMFVDEDNNNDRNGTEEIIRAYPALTGDNTLRFHTDTIMYRSTGMGMVQGTIVLCDRRGASTAKALIINGVGQVRLAADKNNDGIVENINNTNVTC